MIQTGKAPISLMTYLAILSVNLIVNLPGLAVAPMEGRLKELLDAPELQVQLLTILPNFVIIPFVLLSGKLSLARHKVPIIVTGLILYSACAVAYLFADSMMYLIIISCLLGCGAGLLIPFAAGLIADTFVGKYRMKQMGWISGISNSAVVISTFVVGWLIESSNWHLPFVVYLVALIPLVFSFWLRNVPELRPGFIPSAASASASSDSEPEPQKPVRQSSAATSGVSPAGTNTDAGSTDLIDKKNIKGSPVSFTHEMIEIDTEFDLSAGKKGSETVKMKEDIEIEPSSDDLAERAVEIAEEASELSIEALKVARGQVVTQDEIDKLTAEADHLLHKSKGEIPNATAPAGHSFPKTAPKTNVASPQSSSVTQKPVKEFNVARVWALIGVYFFITFTAIAITNYCSQLVEFYNWKSTIAGDVTAVFFLFVLLPGYFLPFCVRLLRGSMFFWTAIMIVVGLGLFVFIKAPWAMFVGSALTGLGYGICQPVIYDKASYTVNNPLKATLALSFVLTANYLAVAIEPFVVSGLSNLFHSDNQNIFAFEFSFGIVIAYTIISLFLRKKFAFSVDKTYYS